jgi:hypothetical protein
METHESTNVQEIGDSNRKWLFSVVGVMDMPIAILVSRPCFHRWIKRCTNSHSANPCDSRHPLVARMAFSPNNRQHKRHVPDDKLLNEALGQAQLS